MGSWGYAAIWAVMTFFPVITAWKRRWAAFAVYTAGWLFYLYSVMQYKDGWDDLADIAILIIVVIPVYLIASIIWIVTAGRKSGRRR